MERHRRPRRWSDHGGGAIDYFVNVIAGGGAKLTRWPGRDLYFTGEAINPVVRLAGGNTRGAKVSLTVTRPAAPSAPFSPGQKSRSRRPRRKATDPVAPDHNARDRKVSPQADRGLHRTPLRTVRRSGADQCHGEKRRAARRGADGFSQRRRHLHLPRGRDLRQGTASAPAKCNGRSRSRSGSIRPNRM